MASKRKSGKSKQQMMSGEDLLVLELQKIHYAETQLSKVLPKFSKVIESDTLREMADERLSEGERLIEEIESALEAMEQKPGRKRNAAAEGLIEDAKENIEELEAGPALDAVLTAALQKTEHYCIAAWGTAKSLGQATGQKEVASAMERAISEGEKFDEKLTELAESELTPALLSSGSEDEAGDSEDEESDEGGGTRSGRSSERRSSAS